MLRKPTVNPEAKTSMSTEQYIQGRISQAADKGYSSTKIWIKKANYDEATSLLDSAGIKFTTVKSDDNSRQLELSW